MATTALHEAPVVPLREVEADTIPKLFLAGVDRHRGDRAMLYRAPDGWRPIGHAEVETRVDRLAAYLSSIGVAPGDRVAILSENRPEWAIADYAVLAIGGVSVPIYTTLPPSQIAYILADSGARAVFVSTRAQLSKILEIRNRTPGLSVAITCEETGGADRVVTLADAERSGAQRIEAGEFPGIRSIAGKVGSDDTATLIYTSGTTGDPKGVMLSHYNIASNVAASEQHEVFQAEPGNVALSFLPLSHAYERMLDYYYWWAGLSIAYVDAVDKVAEAMVEVRPHVVAAAPRVFEKIYARVLAASGLRAKLIAWATKVGGETVEARLAGRQSGPVGLRQKIADRLVFSKLRARTGGRVKVFVSGSAPLSPEIARFFWSAGLPIYEGYGLTESSPVLTTNKPGRVRLGSVGPPLPGTEIRIAPDGEILARGPQVMKGYFGKPEDTSRSVDEDRWLHTGDVGHIDEDGFLWITDRIKNIIVTAGGKNIAPAPIENAAALSPFVSQIVMIGDRRAFPALLVVPDFERVRAWARTQGIADTGEEALVRDPRVHEAIEKDVLSRVTGFARYEQPKKVALVAREFTVESGEITPTLKIKRRVVEENYRDVIDGIYAPVASPA